jgi:glucose/arabinose dehydrogenase
MKWWIIGAVASISLASASCTATPSPSPTPVIETPTTTATVTPTFTPTPTQTPLPGGPWLELESEVWWGDGEGPGYAHIVHTEPVTVEFWHEWIVVQNGTVVLSDASPVPDMVAPSEPGGGQFDGLIVYRIDLGAFSGTAEVRERGCWRASGAHWVLDDDELRASEGPAQYCTVPPGEEIDENGFWRRLVVEGVGP